MAVEVNLVLVVALLAHTVTSLYYPSDAPIGDMPVQAKSHAA